MVASPGSEGKRRISKTIPNPRSLFLWRGAEQMIEFDGVDHSKLPPLYRPIAPRTFRHIPASRCPFCDTALGASQCDVLEPGYTYAMTCPLCGFRFEHHLDFMGGPGGFPMWHRFYFSSLRDFDVNDPEVGLSELGAHLRRNISDIYTLSPRRFEFLVAEVFREHGYAVRLTKAARDGGYDVVLLERGGGQQTLVECKRYQKGRRVGVGVVRQLLGVQLREAARHAKLITTGTFTREAVKEVAQVERNSQFRLELVDIESLMTAMSVFNTTLPSLNVLRKVTSEPDGAT
jgi:Restriction endonuclease